MQPQQVAREDGDGDLANGRHERAALLDAWTKVHVLGDVDGDGARLHRVSGDCEALDWDARDDHIGRGERILLLHARLLHLDCARYGACREHLHAMLVYRIDCCAVVGEHRGERPADDL